MAKYSNREYQKRKMNLVNSENNKYFDYKNTQNIYRYEAQDTKVALELLEQYVEVYPEDISLRENYLTLLIKANHFEKAFEVLNELEPRATREKLGYMKDKKRREEIISSMTSSKIKLLLRTGRYQEAYDFIQEKNSNGEAMNMENISSLIFFLKTNLGLSSPNREDQSCYLFTQMAEYREEDFIEHAKRHIYGYETEDYSVGLFYKDFPIEEIFNEIKENINIENRVSKGILDDLYYFKYDNCGRVGDTKCDYLVIIALANSNNYITMYPEISPLNYPYVDLNYIKEEEDVKVKKKSMVDKFYQRYGK